MRTLLLAGLCLVFAIVAFNRVTGAGVDPDTPVVVYAADPVKVLLPADPDTTDISGYVYAELVASAKRESGVLANDLRSMSEDQELLGRIATSGVSEFSSDRAAALAYPLYGITIESDVIFITTTTVELLPQHSAIGYSIGHEDGHAIINEMIAESCGSFLVRRHADGRLGSRGLEDAIRRGLHEIGDEAHHRYHEMVNGDPSAAFARSARTAAGDVITERC